MKHESVVVVPAVSDRQALAHLPTTPQIRILFHRDLRPRRRSKPLWAYALGLSFLSLGAAYISSAHISLSHLSSLPDYARYRWSGYHRMEKPTRRPSPDVKVHPVPPARTLS